jgi:hypothetical protein
MVSTTLGMRIGTVGPSVPAEFLFSFPQAVSAAAVKMAAITKMRLDLTDGIGRTLEKPDLSAYWANRTPVLRS